MARRRQDPAIALAQRSPRLARAAQLELTARRHLAGLYAGRHRSMLLGSSIDFAEHRPYQPGDELRTIDWRAYARTDRLLIRRQHDERQLPVVLVLDTSGSMAYGEPSKEEQAHILAATLGFLALDQNDAVRVVAGRIDRLTVIGGHGAARLCHAITEHPSHGQVELAGVIRDLAQQLTTRSLLIVLSDLLCEPEPIATAIATAQARGHEVAVLQILDRSEIALPAEWGRVVLDDPEEHMPAIACDAAAAKASYDAEIAKHLRQCHDLIAASGASCDQWCTDTDLIALLGRWLDRRRRW